MHLGVSIKRDSTVHMHLLRHCIIYSVCMLGKIIVETCYGHIIVFMHAYKLYIIVVWQMCGLTNQARPDYITDYQPRSRRPFDVYVCIIMSTINAMYSNRS